MRWRSRRCRRGWGAGRARPRSHRGAPEVFLRPRRAARARASTWPGRSGPLALGRRRPSLTAPCANESGGLAAGKLYQVEVHLAVDLHEPTPTGLEIAFTRVMVSYPRSNIESSRQRLAAQLDAEPATPKARSPDSVRRGGRHSGVFA